MPLVCTTNMLAELDEASLRRFTFKLRFSGMSAAQAEGFFARVFGQVARGLPHGLTPGDFAVAQRRFAFEPDADTTSITSWLEDEVSGRSRGVAAGFETPGRRPLPDHRPGLASAALAQD